MARRKSFELTEDSSAGNEQPDIDAGNVNDVVDPGKIDETVDGASEGGSDGVKYNKDGSIRKKRGPNKNKATSQANKAVPLSVSSIQFSLSGIHSLLAISLFPRDEEAVKALALSEHEAQVLSENIVAVSRHYNLQTTEKAVDWFNLIMALATIEGPRIVLIARKKALNRTPRVQVPPVNRPMTATAQTPPAQQTQAMMTPNGKIHTHPPTPEEREKLLNEAPILTNMQSG